jgi:hypothetical protein
MLSDAEQRSLARIEQLLLSDDPRFGRQFCVFRARRQSGSVVLSVVIAVAALTFLVLFGMSGLTTVFGLLALLSAGWLWAHIRGRPGARDWPGRR